MVCQGCAQAVKEALERVAGVASVTTDFESNTAIVMFDPGKTSVDTLAVAVEGVDRGSAPTFVVTSKRTE